VALFFSESPTNPYLRCVDVPAVAKLCHAAGAQVVIDSTFATPCNQRALALGADLVIHSATKCALRVLLGWCCGIGFGGLFAVAEGRRKGSPITAQQRQQQQW